MATEAVEREAIERVCRRMEAAVRLLYPDDLTPNGKRVLESIIEDERDASAQGPR